MRQPSASTPTPLHMEPKSTLPPRYEAFAQNIARGKTAAESYRLAGYAEKGAHKRAPRMMANEGIQSRVSELRTTIEDQMTITRSAYLTKCWDRFINETRDSAKYGEMLAKAMGWNEAERIDISNDMVVNIRIGGKVLEC